VRVQKLGGECDTCNAPTSSTPSRFLNPLETDTNMKYYTAFTVPINPVGATPVITREQAFKALLVKTEKPQAFVPVISESKVTSRHKTGLVRRVWFKPGVGPPNSQDGLEEEVEFIGDLRVSLAWASISITH
jgi:hypothetical protein